MVEALRSIFGKKKKPKTQTEEELLAEAFAAVKRDQERKARVRRRKYRRWWPEWLDRRVAIGLAIVLFAIIADGVRREDQEFYATVTKVYGRVYVQSSPDAAGKPLEVGARLADRNVVQTDSGSSVVLEFPDGSVITVAPESRLVVKMIEYSRGGTWRGRSFLLNVGQVWARVSPRFGKDSEMRVYTPSSVAAVRGTTFSVYQPSATGSSSIQCAAGMISAIGFRGAPVIVPANTVATVPLGGPPGRLLSLTPNQWGSFNQMDLTKPIPPEYWLKTFELTITQLLDAPLTILGIGKCSWGVGSADFARRAATLEGLRLLHQHLEGDITYPQYVNPATLEQLNIPYEHAQRILSVFHGDALELYRPLADGRGFIIFVRSRDKGRTPYKLTTYGPQRAQEGEINRYWYY